MGRDYFRPIDVEHSVGDSRRLMLPYQQDAINSMNDYFQLDKDESGRRGVVVMPTGSGKTFTAVTWLLNEAIPRGYNVLWLVHRRELVDQAYQEFCNCSPMLKQYGIKNIHITPYSSIHANLAICKCAEISVCCIQSLSNVYGLRRVKTLLKESAGKKLIVVIDEAHHGINDSYRNVLNKISMLVPNYILLGLTATPFRTSDKEQSKLDTLYDVSYNVLIQRHTRYNGYVYEVTLKQLLSQKGTLAKPIYMPVCTQLKACDEYNLSEDVISYYKQFNELSAEALADIANSERRNMFIVDYFDRNKEKFGKTIIFALNQQHARSLCELLKEKGVVAKCAISDNPDSQNVIYEFKENKFPVLVNVQMLTEGSDVPDVQTVFLTRETNSPTLLMQMIGRGLRGTNAKGTETCNVVAFHDVWDRFMSFLSPDRLPLFGLDEEECVEEESAEEIVPAEAEPLLVEDSLEETEDLSTENIDLDFLLKELSAQIKESNSKNEYTAPVIPIGWFHVVLPNATKTVLVYDSQKSSYDELSRENEVFYIAKFHHSGAYIRLRYFETVEHKPSVEDMDSIAQYIKLTLKMPPYYSFQERDSIDLKLIVRQMNLLDSDFEKEEFLSEYYRSNEILKAIYGNLSNFEETVKNYLMKHRDAEIFYGLNGPKKEYRYVPGTHNLTELYNELINSPLCVGLLSRPINLSLRWSDNFVRNWCAICEWNGNVDDDLTRYQIRVNRMYDSPDVDREVIKYLIFHELLHAYGYRNHNISFRKREWQYPNSAELDHFLDTLWLNCNVDDLKGKWVGYESHLSDFSHVFPLKGSDAKGEDVCEDAKTDEINGEIQRDDVINRLKTENKSLSIRINQLNDKMTQQSKELMEIKNLLQQLVMRK